MVDKPHNEHLIRVQRIKYAGLRTQYFRHGAPGLALLPLSERLGQLLDYMQQKQPKNNREMTFFVMYDIEDNRIRRHLAKYLLKKGCVRMQKSVFLGSGDARVFREISGALREINEMYDNHDSIMLFPVQSDFSQHLHMIGKNVDFQFTVKPPKVLII